MKEPRSRIIRDKTDGHIVRRAATNGDDIAPDRIHEVRVIATRNPDNIKVVLANSLVRDKRKAEWTYAVKMYRVLNNASRVSMDRRSTIWHLRGHREPQQGWGSLFL